MSNNIKFHKKYVLYTNHEKGRVEIVIPKEILQGRSNEYVLCQKEVYSGDMVGRLDVTGNLAIELTKFKENYRLSGIYKFRSERI